MGKREVKHIPIKWLFLGMLLITIPFGLYLFLWSTPADNLDTTESSLMQIYAKVPILNRYMYTESWDLSDARSLNDYAVRVWTGHANLRWENDDVKPMGWNDDYGWGVRGPILFRFFGAELLFATFVLINNDIVKTRREKAANPAKNN